MTQTTNVTEHRWDYPDGHPAWVGWPRHPPLQTRFCDVCSRAQYRYAGEMTWRWYDNDGNMTIAGNEDRPCLEGDR